MIVKRTHLMRILHIICSIDNGDEIVCNNNRFYRRCQQQSPFVNISMNILMPALASKYSFLSPESVTNIDVCSKLTRSLEFLTWINGT